MKSIAIVAIALVSLWIPVPPATAGVGQDPSGAVAKLISVVRDAKELAVAREDRGQLFLALPIRNGNIAEAAAAVQKHNQQGQAAKALLQVIAETRSLADNVSQTTCANAVRALGELGSAAKSSLPTLKELATSEDSFVRSEVERALKRIG